MNQERWDGSSGVPSCSTLLVPDSKGRSSSRKHLSPDSFSCVLFSCSDLLSIRIFHLFMFHPSCVRALQVKSLADSMDDSLTCQSGREDSQDAGGDGEEDDDEDEEEGDEEEEEEEEEGEEDEEEDEEEDYRQCAWRNTTTSSRRAAGRTGGGGGRGGAGGGASMHEDSTATSFSDVTLYMDEGCLPSSPLSRPASSSDTEYWGGGGGGSAGGREDSRETEGGSNTSRRSSTPCTECRGEYRGRGGGGGHLPVLTIEPPSDSSVDMSDRSACKQPASTQQGALQNRAACRKQETSGRSLNSDVTMFVIIYNNVYCQTEQPDECVPHNSNQGPSVMLCVGQYEHAASTESQSNSPMEAMPWKLADKSGTFKRILKICLQT